MKKSFMVGIIIRLWLFVWGGALCFAGANTVVSTVIEAIYKGLPAGRAFSLISAGVVCTGLGLLLWAILIYTAFKKKGVLK